MAKNQTYMPFKVGDIVTRQNGKRRMIVRYVYQNRLTAYYEGGTASYSGHYNNFKPYEDQTVMAKDAIYKVELDGSAIFANYRGTDSAGNWLMERIGDGGGIVIVAKEKCEEVLPFTFSVRMSGREQHFIGEAGKLTKGDILLYTAGGADNYAFAVVKAVDTKFKGAKTFEGVRVNTSPI